MANSTEKPLDNNDVRSLVSLDDRMSLGDASWVKTVRADAMNFRYHSCDRIGCFKGATDTERSALKHECLESNVE